MKIVLSYAVFLSLLAASLGDVLDSEGGFLNEPEDAYDEFVGETYQNETEDPMNLALQDHYVEWDIDTPEIIIKKAANVPRGRVLERLQITKQMRNTILRAHNRARSTTRPSASNMLKMTWDNELARLATTYTRKCIYEHNPDPVHGRFDYVGENLFISMGLPFNAKLLDHAVRAWDAEKNVYNYNSVSCQRGRICGHYTQLVWANTFKVGCGVTRCGSISVRGKKWRDAILFGCNYGPGGNYRGEKPYKQGVKCRNCLTGDQCAGKLCANAIRDRLYFNPKLAKWSPWSSWSACTVSCGMGSKKRERKCNTSVESDCSGYGGEVKYCMNKPCTTNQSKFRFDIMIDQNDRFDVNSLLDLFKGNPAFRRPSS